MSGFCRDSLEHFEEFTGNTPIDKITRIQGIEFKAWLQTRGESSKTVFDRLTYVKSLFAFAYLQLEFIPRNPWHGITVDYETETERRPWTAAQISAFFAQPLYTSYALPPLQKGAGADAGYWIPLLGLFTGARSGELCQLQVVDVRQEQGVWVIDINEDTKGASIKNKASRRLVPLHSELVRLGFLEYVEATRKAGEESLWPKLPLREGKASGRFSRWFNEKPRMSASIDIPDFHSLRHTVRTAMTLARIPEIEQDHVTGHAVGGSTGNRVYTHFYLTDLVDAVESIRYDGLNLLRSYKP